jgi:hypothetical protein
MNMSLIVGLGIMLVSAVAFSIKTESLPEATRMSNLGGFPNKIGG